MINKIMLIAGTRPEVIKLAPVYFNLKNQTSLEIIFLSTGQHREMLDQSLRVFGIEPDIDLDLMRSKQDLCGLTARIIEAVGGVLEKTHPDIIIVQGDTTTAFGGAIAAFYKHIPVAHVEAGLRTGDFKAPWPEELNRRLIDVFAEWCFAPTEWSAENLRKEGVPSSKIFKTGNTAIDALFWVLDRIPDETTMSKAVAEHYSIPMGFRERYFRTSEPWILVTGHRRESFGAGFEHICRGILGIVKAHESVGILYPVHLNPNVDSVVRARLGGHPRIVLIPPVSYSEFVWLMNNCRFILTDSGGIQEEAAGLGKPVLVMRDHTERPEGVDAGTTHLVGTDPSRIVKESLSLLEDQAEYLQRSRLKNPYGDGMAAKRIINGLRARRDGIGRK